MTLSLHEPQVATTTARIGVGEVAVCGSRAVVRIFGGAGFTRGMLPHYVLKHVWVLGADFVLWWHTANMGSRVGESVTEEVPVS